MEPQHNVFGWVEVPVSDMATDGTLVYFTAFSGDLNNELGRVEKAGGKVLQEKTLIAEGYGQMALILDTEGNRIALHSR